MRLDNKHLQDFGQPLDEAVLVKGLRELNPDLIFDPAGKLGHYHPMLDNRMGVWLHERHITAMERGVAIPEFNVWAVVKGQRNHIVRIGWRHTLEGLVRRQVPGITWAALTKKFKVDRKLFHGNAPMELELTG